MQNAYIIMDHCSSFEELVRLIKENSDEFSATLNGSELLMETALAPYNYEFLKIEEASLDSLLEEWYEGDPFIELLLKNPRYNYTSSAYYVTASHLTDGSLFRFVVETLVREKTDFLVLVCTSKDDLKSGQDFLLSYK